MSVAHNSAARRLRALAARTGLDGIAEEMLAIATDLEQAAAPEPDALAGWKDWTPPESEPSEIEHAMLAALPSCGK